MRVILVKFYEGENVGDVCAILLPNFRYRTKNLKKLTFIIIVMHANMFDISYDIA